MESDAMGWHPRLSLCVCVSLFLWHINQLTGRLPPVLDRRRLSTRSHTHTPALTLSLRAPPLSWRCVSTTVSSLYSDGWWMFGFSLTGSCSAETPCFFFLTSLSLWSTVRFLSLINMVFAFWPSILLYGFRENGRCLKRKLWLFLKKRRNCV